MEARLGARPRGIHRRLATDDVAMEGVLRVTGSIPRPRPITSHAVRLVVGEERLPARRAVQPAFAELVLEREVPQRLGVAIVGDERHHALRRGPRLIHADPRLDAALGRPAPRIAEPEMGNDVQRRRVGAAIEGLDADADVFRPALRVLDEDVEIAIVVEHARIEQLEFQTAAGARPILVEQPLVWVFRLRILVEHPHVAVRRRVVEIEVVLLDVLAVVAFPRRQTEVPLLQDRIATVPERWRIDEQLVAIAQARDAILAPPVRLAARHVVREEAPRVAVCAVVFADGSPRTIGDVATPPPPWRNGVGSPLGEAALFSCGW